MSITHLQREDTLQVFGCVGHIPPALWPRGCYCKHKGTEASACYAKHTDFLHFYDAVHVPPLPCRLSVCHIGRCTHWAGTYSRQSCRRLQLRSCACSIFRHHGADPLEGRCTQENAGRSSRCHRMDFLREATPFFKGVLGLSSKGLFFCVSMIRREAQKVNNQF